MLGETWRHCGVHEELSRLTNLCLYASIFLSPRQASELKPDVETTCHPKQPNQRLPSQISLGHILPNQNDVLLSQVRAGMYGETWCRSRVQTDMHSKVFLRSGQACTLPPGVARESRNDQCQYQYQMQFTRTCSRTSLRHVLCGLIQTEISKNKKSKKQPQVINDLPHYPIVEQGGPVKQLSVIAPAVICGFRVPEITKSDQYKEHCIEAALLVFFWLVAAWVKSRAERPSVSVVNRQLHVQIGCKLGIRNRKDELEASKAKQITN